MSLNSVVESTRKYLEAKYDVDLSDVTMKRSIFGFVAQHYRISKKTVYTPYLTGGDAICLSFTAWRAAETFSSGVDLFLIPAAYSGLFVVSHLLKTGTTVIHELTHSVSDKITETQYFFDEALSIHEEFKNPNASKLERLATRLFYIEFPTSVLLRDWEKIFRWMDDDNRENYIRDVKKRLDDMGSPHAERFCAELYGMRPRQFVEDHRLLRGLRRYLGSGNPKHLERARDGFLQHGGGMDATEKYFVILPRSTY